MDPNKLVFEAQLSEAKGEEEGVAASRGTGAGRRVVVKFLQRTYGADAHNAAAAVGVAPVLRDHVFLGSGANHWQMVVMDYVNGQTIDKASVAQSVAQTARAAVDALHGEGFVHGDLRGCNIIHSGESGVRIVDFDWAGPVSSATYPTLMNHADIAWPEGVRAGQQITVATDKATLETLALALV